MYNMLCLTPSFFPLLFLSLDMLLNLERNITSTVEKCDFQNIPLPRSFLIHHLCVVQPMFDLVSL